MSTGINFPDSHKCACSKKNGVGIFESLNSNSFDLNSNDLNRKWVIGGPKMFGFLVELRKMTKEFMGKVKGQET